MDQISAHRNSRVLGRLFQQQMKLFISDMAVSIPNLFFELLIHLLIEKSMTRRENQGACIRQCALGALNYPKANSKATLALEYPSTAF